MSDPEEGLTYAEPGRSMREVAELCGRSTATVKREIDLHNRAIIELGECPKCRNASSDLSKTVVMKRKRL